MGLSFKRRAETVQQSLSDPAQRRKAEREVAAFRRFQQLSAELPAPPVERDLADPELPDRLCHCHALAVQDFRLPQRTYLSRIPPSFNTGANFRKFPQFVILSAMFCSR